MSEYMSDIYTSSYIESKNVLSLCFNNKLRKDITNKIDEYLIEYATGFALFNNKEYKINGEFIHRNRGGHPFEPLLKFISKYCMDSILFNMILDSEIYFYNILDKINKVPNNQKIDLTECLSYMMRYNGIKSILKNDADFCNLLVLFIGNYKLIRNISHTGVNRKHIKNIDGSYRKHTRPDLYTIYLPNDYNNLEDLIIQNSQYTKIDIINIDHIIYEKTLIKSNDINYFNIERGFFEEKKLLKIPLVLALPEFVYVNNDKKILSLLAIVIYNIIKQQYSIIIKESDGKFYHHLHDKIIETDNDYFNYYTSQYSTGVFYGKQ